MRLLRVVGADVALKNPSQVCLVEDDHVVKALPPDAPDESLRVAILLRRSVCRQYWFHTKSCNGFCEDFPKRRIPIPHQEPG